MVIDTRFHHVSSIASIECDRNLLFSDPPNHSWFHHISSRDMTTKHVHPKFWAIFTKFLFFSACVDLSWYISGSRCFANGKCEQCEHLANGSIVPCNLDTSMWSLCPYFPCFTYISPTNPAHSIGSSISQALDSTSCSWLEACAKMAVSPWNLGV